MCGITGWWAAATVPERVLTDVTASMSAMLQHRGPDGCGIWADATVGLALAHTRLAILDLTAAGHQPMLSRCGRYVLSFNGEIYNHLDLRAALIAGQGEIGFVGHSDTETLLTCIASWGLENALRASHGMFSLSLWDRQEQKLHLARDRVGEKPLYYGLCGKGLIFGSELKALTAHPKWDARIDAASLGLYLRHGYVPAPHSIFEGVAKVMPGEILTFGRRDNEVIESGRQCYWHHEIHIDTRLDAHTAVERLDALLRATIRREMLADVPVGAFLSGGIDSSLVVALMQQESPGAVQTFTIGFDDPRYDEAEHAHRIATFLGTQHEALRVTAADALSVIPTLPECYDEPFADSSAIPTILVSRLARRSVTVALSGDGGDELFGGYNHYQWGDRLNTAYRLVPRGLRSIAGGILGKAAQSGLPRAIGARLARAADLLAAEDHIGLLIRIGSHWYDPSAIVRHGVSPYRDLEVYAAEAVGLPFVELMMLHDKRYFLPDDIMAKVDRASMSVSLESRAPFLDHAIAEFAASLPIHLKIRNNKGKWLLRQLLKRYIPENLTERPKMGFGAPVGSWLRGPLRCWAEDLLNERRLGELRGFDVRAIRAVWEAHREGRQERGTQLWNLLMFLAWLDHQKKVPSL